MAILTGPDMMEEYYSRIDKTMEHYERHPGQLEHVSAVPRQEKSHSTRAFLQQSPLDALRPAVKFSGEEVYGRCLDLTAHHAQLS